MTDASTNVVPLTNSDRELWLNSMRNGGLITNCVSSSETEQRLDLELSGSNYLRSWKSVFQNTERKSGDLLIGALTLQATAH